MTTVCFWASAGPANSAASSAAARARQAARRARISIQTSLTWGEGVSCLLRHEAAVHDHFGSGHEGRFVRGEEERGIGDVPRLADAPQRDTGLELGAEL